MIFAVLLTLAAPTPLSVEDVLDRVEKFDPLARARAYDQLRAEIALRRAQWNQVQGSAGINAGYGATYTGFGTLPVVADAQATFFDRFTANINAQLTYPIYAGGAVQGAIDAARARADVARLDRKTQVRDLKRAAIMAYAQVIAATQQLEISTRAKERSHLIVELAQKRKTAGMATDADTARALLNELRQTEDVELKKGDRAVALAALRAALLYPQDTDLLPSDSLERVAHLAGARDKSEGDQRYEALSLKSQVLAAEADRAVAFSGWLPRLELYLLASYGNGSPLFVGGQLIANPGTDPRFGLFSGNLQGGIRLSWTIWDFFVTRDQVAQAAAARDSLDAQRVDTERRVERERAEFAARLQQAEKRVEALAGGKEVAESSVKLARVRYETGNAVLTEVLDAEIEAISVQGRIVQAAYDRASAWVDKLRAEGQDL